MLLKSGILGKYFDLYGTIGESLTLQATLVLIIGAFIIMAVILIAKFGKDFYLGFRW